MYDDIVTNYYDKIKTSVYYDSIKPCNDFDLLYADFRLKIIELKSKYLEQHETEPYILETYRSNDLQIVYYNRGASKTKKDGMHHFGIAVDIVGKTENGIDYNILDYDWLRKYAKNNLGLTVLNFELGHFQYIPVENQNILRKEIKNYANT